jgi:phosphate transport system protein
MNMTRIIDDKLEELSVVLCKMGDLTYQTLLVSIEGYLDGRSVTYQVRDLSDMLLALSDKVEDESFQLIARFQPVASDLRAIKSYMKIGNDFARYGRYALDISYINDKLKGLSECETWAREPIEEMSDKVLSMVKLSIAALKKLNANLARTVSESERQVDKMFLDYLQKLISAENANSKCIISSALVARYLERIADHATYVCESIVYIVTGEKITLR